MEQIPEPHPRSRNRSSILKWLPVGHDLRTTVPIISIGYKPDLARESATRKSQASNKPQKHIIHRAILWRKMLDEGTVDSLNQIAKNEGLTRARVTQIMNLLKLPVEFQEFLAKLDDPREVRKYSERRLRKSLLKLP